MQSHARTMQNLTMQRRHFQLIAEVLASLKRTTYGGKLNPIWVDACERMADALARTNPGFDRARFLAACGME